MDFYWQVQIDRFPVRLERPLTRFLFQHGCLGTQEELKFTQPDLRYEPVVVGNTTGTLSLSAFFPLGLSEFIQFHLSKWVLDHAPMAMVHWIRQENQDWLTEWKKHFKPFKLAGFEMRPVWINPKISLSVILLEPGMAFGTGTHSTTRFAIQMLKKLHDKKKVRGKKVLDVGAGSGILATVAIKMGAASALAIDNDPNSWRESKKMFRLNKLRGAKVSEIQIDKVRQKYDVVMANIIDGILMDIKDHLWKATLPGGYLILSGILKAGEKAFIKDFCKDQDVVKVASKSDGEWAAYCLQKKS